MNHEENDNDNLKKLLQLKRYETPGEEYFDQFLSDFQARRAAEEKRQNSPALFGQSISQISERVIDWYQDLGHGKWAVPAGSVAAAALAFMAVGGKDSVSRAEPAKLDVNPSGDAPPAQVIEIKIPKIAGTDVDTDSTEPIPRNNPSLLPAKSQ